MCRKRRQQKTTHSPIEYGWLLFLDVVGGDVAGLVAVVHDPPPVLWVVKEEQALILAEVQLMAALGRVVILGRHPAVLPYWLACHGQGKNQGRGRAEEERKNKKRVKQKMYWCAIKSEMPKKKGYWVKITMYSLSVEWRRIKITIHHHC